MRLGGIRLLCNGNMVQSVMLNRLHWMTHRRTGVNYPWLGCDFGPSLFSHYKVRIPIQTGPGRVRLFGARVHAGEAADCVTLHFEESKDCVAGLDDIGVRFVSGDYYRLLQQNTRVKDCWYGYIRKCIMMIIKQHLIFYKLWTQQWGLCASEIILSTSGPPESFSFRPMQYRW